MGQALKLRQKRDFYAGEFDITGFDCSDALKWRQIILTGSSQGKKSEVRLYQ